ncbi:MAG: acetyl-CoA carboxylase biotin carboxyl carrier protein subunit [Candidatus Marinimicrobia bacterium]|nr:acetyl-CoA carboxylase biotin carboxyl carrier protein subunit [Candidatus Neomarinimicrobiota bacterium]MBL7022549.1 acetyl-CoA carboxylase biotin carboxyl carrier protein subunit [Candidatus Neomarinimicrobiota bacterium]MBL7108905.1 acetyl-CoA carboxylase biotin carboxyl carrier protein subunit [Candidatus Neomarinimicrobiota bacterium]
MKFQAIIDEQILNFDVEQTACGLDISFNDNNLDADCRPLTSNSFSLILNGKSHYLTITENDNSFEVTVDQHTNLVKVKDETELLLDKFGFSDSDEDHAGEIHAQIPGLVTQIYAEIGSSIEKGQKLFILEAMKMENEISSPVSGVVKNILVEIGLPVEKNDLIMEIEI